MKNIIYKELKLVIIPATYLIVLLAALIMIPNYPYLVGMSYCFLALFISFSTAQTNKDNEFTASLPVPRKNIVLAKHVSFITVELLQIVVAIPFALLSTLLINKNGNLVGLDANFTFFGVTFLCFGVINIIVLPWFFRTGYKIGIPFLTAIFTYVILYVCVELAVQLSPLKAILDGTAAQYIPYRITVLFSGIAVYCALTFISYKRSVKNFEKVNL